MKVLEFKTKFEGSDTNLAKRITLMVKRSNRSLESRQRILMTPADSRLMSYFKKNKPKYVVLKNKMNMIIPLYKDGEIITIIQSKSFRFHDEKEVMKVVSFFEGTI